MVKSSLNTDVLEKRLRKSSAFEELKTTTQEFGLIPSCLRGLEWGVRLTPTQVRWAHKKYTSH